MSKNDFDKAVEMEADAAEGMRLHPEKRGKGTAEAGLWDAIMEQVLILLEERSAVPNS